MCLSRKIVFDFFFFLLQNLLAGKANEGNVLTSGRKATAYRRSFSFLFSNLEEKGGKFCTFRTNRLTLMWNHLFWSSFSSDVFHPPLQVPFIGSPLSRRVVALGRPAISREQCFSCEVSPPLPPQIRQLLSQVAWRAEKSRLKPAVCIFTRDDIFAPTSVLIF